MAKLKPNNVNLGTLDLEFWDEVQLICSKGDIKTTQIIKQKKEMLRIQAESPSKELF